MKSNEPEKTKGNQEAPTVKVEEALENDTTKKDEPKPSTGDGGAAADSKETKSEGGSKSEWAKNRSKGKSEKKDEPKEEPKKEEPKKEESKEASAKVAEEPLETSTIETVDPENWESVQAELLNNGYAEECPSCGAISTYDWNDANYCENCTEPMGLDLPEQDRIYHIGAASGFEWECGKCRSSWTPADSPLTAEVYTHRDPNAEFEVEGSLESVDQLDAMLASDDVEQKQGSEESLDSYFAAEKTADTADNEYNVDSAANPTDSETGESATVKCHKEHDQQVKKADVADNPENEKGDKVAGRTITPKYVIRIPGSTDAAWDVGTRGQLRGAGQPNDANLARYMDALLKSMEPGGHNEHLQGRFDPQTAAVYRNDGTYKNPLATWSKDTTPEGYVQDEDGDLDLKQGAEKTALGPCMCGDTNCPSCGGAMGTWPPAFCPICNVPAEDCLTHFDEDGEVRPEFIAEMKSAEELYAQEQAKADEGMAESLAQDEELARQYWEEEAAAGRPVNPRHLQSSDVSGDIAEAKSEVVSPDTVDADIKQPTESVEEAGKQAGDKTWEEEAQEESERDPSEQKYKALKERETKPANEKDAAAPAVALEGGEFPYVETLVGMGWDDTGEPGHFMKDGPRVEVLTFHDGYQVYVDGELYEEGDNVDELQNTLEVVNELGVDSLNAHQASDIPEAEGESASEGQPSSDLGDGAPEAHDVPPQVDDKTACAGYGDEEDEESPIDLGLGDMADLVVGEEEDAN